MAADDLTAPLGREQTSKRRFALPIGISHLLIGALGLSVAVFGAWALIADDPFGGEPIVLVPTNLSTEGGAKAELPAAKSASADKSGPSRYDGPEAGSALPPGTRTITIIDGSSGKREQVAVPNTLDDKSAPADTRLAEPSPHGLLPKIAQDGARPADVFARPVKAIPDKPNAPRIAIVVGGLGTSTTVTADALKKLPGPVTIAFMPYGRDLPRQVSRARNGGHEVLLQVPMEPFDYPDNDPGPQTLLTSLDATQNLDRLHALMGRAQGYVGISNFMGGRFSASDQSLAVVLRETAKRGLIYFDDGSSPRSLASQYASANSLAFAKSDLTIDATPTPAEIDRALARLETLARDRGSAVGTAGALPVSIDRIAKWVKAAEGRGVLLVPISAVAAKPKSS